MILGALLRAIHDNFYIPPPPPAIGVILAYLWAPSRSPIWPGAS